MIVFVVTAQEDRGRCGEVAQTWSVADGFVVVDSDAAVRRAYRDISGVEIWPLAFQGR